MFPQRVLDASEESLLNVPQTGGYDTATLLGRLIQNSDMTNRLLEAMLEGIHDMRTEMASLRRSNAETTALLRGMRTSPISTTGSTSAPEYDTGDGESTSASQLPRPPPSVQASSVSTRGAPIIIGRPVGKPRVSLATTSLSHTTISSSQAKYYYPAGKSISNKFTFMAAVVRHVMEAVIADANKSHAVDYIDTRTIDTSTLTEVVKVANTSCGVLLPELKDVRVYLPFIASSSSTVTKETVVQDLVPVMQDMNVRSSFQKVLTIITEFSPILPIAYRAAVNAIREPYISDGSIVYDSRDMKKRPEPHIGSNVVHMKAKDVKEMIDSYMTGARTPAALEITIKAFYNKLKIAY